MSSKLPLNLQDVLHQRTVEGDRIEYKAGWNPDATLRTLCGFANDFENLGGVYVVIGRVRIEALRGGGIIARRYRNRRIGDFLKELDLTEGRCTGIPIMREAMRGNGSRPPRFETDEDRTYFFVELPIPPEFLQDHRPRKADDEAHDRWMSFHQTEQRIIELLQEGSKAVPEIVAALGQSTLSGAIKRALKRLEELGVVALTISEKPRSKYQKRQLTDKGRKATQRG